MEETERPTEPAKEVDDKLGPWPRPPLREGDVERTPTFMPDPAVDTPAEPATPPHEGDLTARHPPPLYDPERTRVFSGGVPGHTVEKPEIEEGPVRWQPWGDTPSSQPTRPRPTWEPRRESQPTPRRPTPEASPPPVRRPVPSSTPPSVSRPRQGPKRDWMGGLLQAALYSAIAGVILFFVALAVASVGYVVIAAQLPAPGELAARASDFETSTILDAQGNLLYELIPSDAGRRQRVSLNQISELLVQATVATEDRYFYQHPGFDPIGIARALIQNLREQEVVSGASTITQQLARMLLLSPEERTQETMERKIREAILAAEITRRYSKEEILEIYLNELNYGNLAYGIEAAAQTYFQKSARGLTLAEASFVAGLPQAPAAWDPFTAPEYAIGRQGQVLALMVEAGYITWDQADTAAAEMEQRISELIPPHVDMYHPHFVNSVRQELESLLGPQSSYRQGIRVITTLDPALQATAEGVIAEHGPHLANWGANNAALIAIDPHTGRILAMIGSVDFYSEEISGQVNMLLAGRQPGSSIKPLTYVTAFEKNWTASSLIWDVQTTFTDEWGQTYTPKNYDGRFHGPTLVRGALANSYNLPAVRALDFVGVCDFIQRANEIGIHSLQDSSCQTEGKPSRYGLSLTLGGGEVTPLEMATLYSTLAGNGGLNQPVTIARIEDLKGNLIYEHTPEPEQVIRPEHAFLINDILSDNASRLPAFGPNNRLEFTDRPVAAKTGTSGTDATDVRDGWTLGYTPDLVVAVWTGNTDNTPMAEGASGYKVASPIWRAYMDRVLVTQPASGFPRPANIVLAEICGDSGTRPSADCPAEARRWELYASGQPPLGPEHDFYQRLQVDLWTGFQANEHCGEAVEEELFLVIQDESGRRWIEETASGRAWAAARGIVLETRPGDPSPRLRLPPSEVCTLDTPRPRIRLTAPTEGQIITGELIIFGEVTAPNLRGYQVDYGLGPDPQGWGVVQDRVGVSVQAGEIARWDTTQVGDQDYTLRVIIFGPPDRNGTEIQFQGRVHVQVSNPTPTPTVTPTPTATYTPSPTPTPTETPSPSPTALTPTPSPTVLPSETPTPTLTGTSLPPPDTPTPTPTVEGTPTPTPTATETPSS